MVPFGMVAPGPDCADRDRDRGWGCSSGYQFRAPRILGLSNTHISGSGIPELGDVLLMPAAGQRWREASTDCSVAADKPSESAHPGVYRGTLPARSRHGRTLRFAMTPAAASSSCGRK